jgi:DNA repair exonuclease SbcCD ATPase subunit
MRVSRLQSVKADACVCFVFVQLAVFKDQNTQLLEEFALLSQQLSSAQESYNELEAQMARLLGEPGALETATIEECEELEGQLKGALQRIDAKKVSFVREMLRLCWRY